MTQFINISNHRLSTWSEPQLAEAERWAQAPRHTFLDIVHPPIPPAATWDEVHSLVENTLGGILAQLDLLGDAAHLSVAADDAFSAVPGAYAGSQLGMTYKALASALGYATETVWRWENNRTPITLNVATQLRQLAGISTCPTCGQSLMKEMTPGDKS